jgi:bifunctional UDP-N-acetylglucosamine pyrophosphorylase/glucosamine-1-phosphate N-acetyltransferase
MKSNKPKVLHEIANCSMLGHVMATVMSARATEVAVVIGPDREDVAREAHKIIPDARAFVQWERRDTGYAVLSAREALERKPDDIIIVYADTPLVTSDTLAKLREPLANGAAVVGLGSRPAIPLCTAASSCPGMSCLISANTRMRARKSARLPCAMEA